MRESLSGIEEWVWELQVTSGLQDKAENVSQSERSQGGKILEYKRGPLKIPEGDAVQRFSMNGLPAG